MDTANEYSQCMQRMYTPRCINSQLMHQAKRPLASNCWLCAILSHECMERCIQKSHALYVHIIMHSMHSMCTYTLSFSLWLASQTQISNSRTVNDPCPSVRTNLLFCTRRRTFSSPLYASAPLASILPVHTHTPTHPHTPTHTHTHTHTHAP